ncbi:MAG: hypothetical protein Kow0042_16160 [Calditrichia bacterium]
MTIKGFNIQREISRGPITTSYLAVQETLERTVLLKVLNVQWQKEKDLLERFHREAKIYARLRHPNIVTVFDFGLADEVFYLAMEYVEGHNLHELIRNHHPLPCSLIIYICREILKGLAYAHQMGIIHRDIKPSNILAGNQGEIKIADFGLASIADMPRITEQDATVGTPAYISPEQVRGEEIDLRSDLFSLGVSLYEMCTGESPFYDKSMAVTINRILTHQPPSLEKIRDDLPGWFIQIIEGCLQKERKKRPASAAEVLENEGFNQFPLREISLDRLLHPQNEDQICQDEPLTTAPTRKTISVWWGILPLFILLLLAAFFIWINPTLRLEENHSSGAPLSGKAESTGETGEQNPAILDTAVGHEPSPVPSKTPVLLTENHPEKSGDAVLSPEEIEIPAPAPGGLFIACYPWAKIYINGEYRETTPIAAPFELAAGEYFVELKNPNFQPKSFKVRVHSNQIDTFQINLDPAKGTLSLRVVPWGVVYIDNREIGLTPLVEPLTLTAGEHVLRIENPNFPVLVDTLGIQPGENLQKFYNLKKEWQNF